MISTPGDATRYSVGARFMPTVNPIVARPNTNDSAEREMPSSASIGFRNTLNA
jgi:hypothetical protein